MSRFLATCLLALAVSQAAAAEKPLSYRQEKALELQEKELTALGSKFAFLIAKAKAANTEAFPANQLSSWLSQSELTGKLDSVVSELRRNGVPMEHPRAKEIERKLGNLRSWVPELKKAFQHHLETAKKKGEAGSYEGLEEDRSRLDEIAERYAGVANLSKDTERTAEVAAGYAADGDWVREREGHYKGFLATKSGPANDLKSKITKAKGALEGFEKKGAQFREEASTRIPEALEYARSLAKKAQDEQRSSFFTGARKSLEGARSRIEIYEALAGKAAAAGFREHYAGAEKEVEAAALKLKEVLLADARAPEDAYSGSDRDELRDMVEKAWKEKYPEDKILAVRLHKADWVRKEERNYNEAVGKWWKTDMSILVAVVIVQTDARVATMYRAYVNKDNLSGKTILGVDTKGGTEIAEEMLLKNFK